MKVCIPLSIATALTLSLFSMDAIAATPAIDINPTSHQMSSQSQPTFYVKNAGTSNARKVYYFNRLDRNHDGQLSRSEIPRDMKYLRSYFIEQDWDHNGKLSPEEYVLYEKHQAPEYAGVYRAIVFVY